MSSPILDNYTAAAQNDNVTPNDKIAGLHSILSSAKIGMLTTRSADGDFHSRAMTPTSSITFLLCLHDMCSLSHSVHSETQLTLTFLANNASHKFDEIEHDSNVNVSFLDQASTAWASYCGKAKIDNSRDSIKKHWSPYVSAYFGDLKDGVHKGDENDPRISIIQVVPEEIRYWLPTKGTIGRAIETGVSKMTGKVAAPGELRTITKAEIQLTQGLHTK